MIDFSAVKAMEKTDSQDSIWRILPCGEISFGLVYRLVDGFHLVDWYVWERSDDENRLIRAGSQLSTVNEIWLSEIKNGKVDISLGAWTEILAKQCEKVLWIRLGNFYYFYLIKIDERNQLRIEQIPTDDGDGYNWAYTRWFETNAG